MTNTDDTQSLTMEFDLPNAPAKVWRALTEPELLAKWLTTTDTKLAVGQSFTFKMPPTQGLGWRREVRDERDRAAQTTPLLL